MRLGATIRCDVRLQWRNGFYYASALVVVVSIVFLRWLTDDAVTLLLPVIIFQNVLMNSFYFVAGLTLPLPADATIEENHVEERLVHLSGTNKFEW